MDPNAALSNIRRLASEILDPDPSEILVNEGLTDDLATAVQGLDEWLAKGGFLPGAWHTPGPRIGEIVVPVGDIQQYDPPSEHLVGLVIEHVSERTVVVFWMSADRGLFRAEESIGDVHVCPMGKDRVAMEDPKFDHSLMAALIAAQDVMP